MRGSKHDRATWSNELVERLTDLKEAEARKRNEPIGTPRYHELADEVTAKSRAIFELAKVQSQLGEAPESGQAIESISGHGA
jgi:hypothetical protein